MMAKPKITTTRMKKFLKAKRVEGELCLYLVVDHQSFLMVHGDLSRRWIEWWREQFAKALARMCEEVVNG